MTDPDPGVLAGQRPQLWVAAGTTLVLVTYVTPIATLPRTALDLAVGEGGRAWILSSMSLGLAAALLAAGAIGDAVGRRRVYQVGLAVMALAALACAAAPTTLVLVLARVVEGIGGAAVLACGLATMAAAAGSPEARSRSSAVWGASVGLGISLGVILAAALAFGSGWRETYAVTGAAGLLLLLPGRRGLPESSSVAPRRFDLPGVVLLGGAMTVLVAALTEARSGLSPVVVVLFVLGTLLVAAFALVELRVSQPVIEPLLWRSPGFLAATLGSLVLGGGIIAMASYAPSLVQQGLGEPLWVASSLTLSWSVTSVVTSVVVRRLPIPLSGPATIAAALLVVGLGQLLGLGVRPDATAWRLVPALFVAGLATGVLNAVLGREAVASVPVDRSAMGSGSNNTARYLGAALGVTVFAVLATHAGSGTGPAALVRGWDVAVLVAASVSLVGAAVVGLVGVLGRRREHPAG